MLQTTGDQRFGVDHGGSESGCDVEAQLSDKQRLL